MRRELSLSDTKLGEHVATTIREARQLIGWTQAELARRARTSQSRISRLETGAAGDVDTALVAAVLTALGHRGVFVVEDRHLDDRREQRGPIHGIVLGHTARRLRAWGWETATEVEIQSTDGVPRGWIDLLAHRRADGAGLLGEIKGDIPDPGALQRQVAFYEREASGVMRRLGWPAARIATLVVALDTAPVHATLRAHASLLGPAFPGTPAGFTAWLRTPHLALPPRTIALVDPRSRRTAWLLRTPLSGRRSQAAFASYAGAAQELTRRRPPRGPPGRRPSSSRSPPG
jgi:transcriptional regulator with XRE-family HTH domain